MDANAFSLVRGSRMDPDCIYLKLESVSEDRIHAFCFSDIKFLFTSEEDNTIYGFKVMLLPWFLSLPESPSE